MEEVVRRKKKNKRRNKKNSPVFRYFIILYMVLWLVATVVVCRILWSSLKKYQNDYNVAEATADPEIAIKEAMAMFSEGGIRELVAKQKPEVISRFEGSKDYEDFYCDFARGKNISYVKDEERYHNARPVYDIYAQDDLFAVVSLKPAGEKDSFGFNRWTVKDVILSENNYEFYDVYLKVMDDMSVYINGIAVGEQEYVREGQFENSLTEKAYALTGKSFGYKVYYAGGMIKKPRVTVLDVYGNDITGACVMEENDLRSYVTLADKSFVDSVYERVKYFCETYVYHIYHKAKLEEVAVMMEDGSEAELLLHNAQSTLAWAWVPDKVEILSEEYDDFVHYNDEYFSCRCTIKIRKSDATTVEDETFVCQWLFKWIAAEGSWQVTYFLLK